VSEFLCDNGIDSSFYHAGMKSDEREALQNEFMAGKKVCIVATIAFGMGIDKSDIRRIIHFDLPKSIENYSQEIGRSGRDGETAWCEVLASRDNVNVLENFIYGDTPEKNSIIGLLTNIKVGNGTFWECKLQSLSRELNIRPLPLKTLLVYLDMEGILRPKWTYFEEYAFKNGIEHEVIVNRFKDERKKFVSAIFDNCKAKKTWTSVNIQGVIDSYPADRARVIAALNYFEEQGWFELQAKQAVDVYDIIDSAFDVNIMADKMYDLFAKKEANEIQRIHNMLAFLEVIHVLVKGSLDILVKI
jgi:ATP-dependent DNA helicase RecQ